MVQLSHLLLFIILLYPFSQLNSQQSEVSKLQSQLTSAQGSERVDILNKLSEQLKFSQPDQAKKYVEEAYALSDQLSYAKGLSTSAFYLGIFERDQGNFNKSIRIINKGLEAARAINDYPAALMGLDILKTIYQMTGRNKRLDEVNQMYKQIKTRLDLRQTSAQLEELERVVEFKEDVLNLSEQERLKVTAEKEAVLNELAQTTEEKLRKEAELARIAQERAELESRTIRLEKESIELEKNAIESALQLEKERNIRNLAIALAGVLVFLILAGWQRYRYKRQQKLAEIERQRVQRLQEIDRLKDQFLANTSHELRTPLNGIIGIAEWLQEKRKEMTPEILKENLSMLISAGKRLNNLVNDIMDFSRLKNDELLLHLKPVDVYSLSEVILRINQPLASIKKLRLVNAIPKGLPAALADEDRLQQVLHNLVGNAIKFTNEGTITLSALHSKGELKISVTDTGIGIPPEKHETIFQAFQQEDGSMVREFAGTGLGLSITKHLVELHKGKIGVESSPGKGSTFYFSIPQSDDTPINYIPPSEPAFSELSPLLGESLTRSNMEVGPSTDDFKVNILIVDDEPINQHVLSNHLDSGYYRISTAMNGEDALKAIEGPTPFDLVILDVMMPRMTGYEVCEKIRKKYLPSELPVIMVTAKNLVKDLVEGLNTGANDYLAKPFSREEFLARVKTQLNLHTINKATGRFVPNAFLRTLGKENITEVHLGDQVEQVVTVFFSDIRSYTTLAESMTPDENFKFVNSFNRRMGPIIDHHHGFVNQYLGDAIMAIFQQRPLDALQAAIEFQLCLRTYNQQRLKQKRFPITTGIGFHTGKLIMGIIGDEKRMDAATISDTVNTAARLESLNKHYGTNILLSEDSLAGIDQPENFHLRFLGNVQMKGKKRPVGVYECFNGDQPSLVELKEKTLGLFENGLQHFFAKEFKAARQAFEEIARESPSDLTSQMFLKKSRQYFESGTPQGWTGIEKMRVK